MNATYTVNIGPQARVGQITLEGKDPGLTVDELRKKGKLKQGSKVNRDTVSNALTRLRAQYREEGPAGGDDLAAAADLQPAAQAGGLRLQREPGAAGEGGGGGGEACRRAG